MPSMKLHLHKSSLIMMAALALISGCAGLKESRPILPIRDYEKMVVGDLNADYIGTQNCLAACHEHDKLKQFFDIQHN